MPILKGLMNVIWLTVFLQLTACTHVFFQPSNELIQTPEVAKLSFEDVTFDQAGKTLHGWWIPSTQAKSKGTIVFSHGNGGNIGSHLPFVYWVPKAGYNLFMFDYQGYGLSTGRPSAGGIVSDTVAALEWVEKHKLGPGEQLILLGHSLGGAAAIGAIAEKENTEAIAAVMVDSTFSNYRDEARYQLKRSRITAWLTWLVPALVTGQHASDEMIQTIAPIPVVVSHSVHDVVIPWTLGRKLYESAEQPKSFHTLKATHHNHGWRHERDRQWLLSQFERFLVAQ